MYTDSKVCIFNTNVEPLTSGSRVFKKDEIVDINELHECLKDSSKYVVICNDVSAHSSATKKQYFILTDVLTAEDGYEDTYMFSHMGRSSVGVTERKIMMSFSEVNDNPTLKATYFAS